MKRRKKTAVKRLGEVKKIEPVTSLGRKKKESSGKPTVKKKIKSPVPPPKVNLLPSPPPSWLRPDYFVAVTEMAQYLGMSSGRKVNEFIGDLGWQQKIAGEWVVTPLGEKYCQKNSHDITKRDGSSETKYYYKWNFPAVKAALRGQVNTMYL